MSPDAGLPAAGGTAQDRLVALVEPLVRARGLDLEDLTVSRAGRRRRVVVAVDRDGGVSLDECAELSRELSAALDAPAGTGALGDDPYVLEVGSPGLDRPLTAPRHWRRSTGRLVRAVDPAGHVVVGRVVEAGDDAARIEVDGTPRELAYADVSSARVQVEFAPPAALGADERADGATPAAGED